MLLMAHGRQSEMRDNSRLSLILNGAILSVLIAAELVEYHRYFTPLTHLQPNCTRAPHDIVMYV